MAWIILCGIDRSGKSTVAKRFEADGYKVIHLSAPDKKYSKPGYAGPSYLDEMIELMVENSGKDVVFDRSWYGELVWPYVYGRKPLLNEEDFEILREIEEQNSTTRILLTDPDIEAHWARCVTNKEPLDRSQFNSAMQLYIQMAKKYEFTQRDISNFAGASAHLDGGDTQPKASNEVATASAPEVTSSPKVGDSRLRVDNQASQRSITPEQIKLANANAINDILSSRIVKKKGDIFDSIEDKIRSFLNSELGVLLGTNQAKSQTEVQIQQLPFSKEDVVFLKTLIKRAKETRK